MIKRIQQVRQVLVFTLVLNISVAAAKIIYGYATDSISMLSDGFHSFSDGTSNIIGLIGIWISSRPPDESHPYGHRKFETLSVIAIALLIFASGLGILREAYQRIQSVNNIEVTTLSFIVMAVTLAVNIFVMQYETRKGRELKSDFLLADSMHTRTDIYISLSVVISLIAAKIGYPFIDILTALIIVVFIAKTGFSILKPATDVLTDSACINPDEIRDATNSVKGVMGSHHIRTRGTENHVNIDLHIFVDPEAKTRDSHEVAHSVEEILKNKFPAVKDVVIHVEPSRRRPS